MTTHPLSLRWKFVPRVGPVPVRKSEHVGEKSPWC